MYVLRYRWKVHRRLAAQHSNYEFADVKYNVDRVNHRDGYSVKNLFRSSARGASFHTKHSSNANVVRVVLLDENSY
jgi:hypothetical protein